VSLESGLVAHLMADGDVADLIGSRLYPLRVPQDVVLPAVVYQVITDIEEHTHDGPSGLVQARMQMTYHGSTYSEAKSVKDAILASIDGFSGTMGSTAVASVESQAASDSWSTAHEVPVVRQDFMVWYQRS
jgi:hypothetical protein